MKESTVFNRGIFSLNAVKVIPTLLTIEELKSTVIPATRNVEVRRGSDNSSFDLTSLTSDTSSYYDETSQYSDEDSEIETSFQAF